MKIFALLLVGGCIATAGAMQAPASGTAPAHKTSSGVASSGRSATAAGAETHQPPPPKTPQELQQELTAALQAAPFANDSIDAAVQGTAVTLTGTVHSAERKGLATRLARSLAQKGGWSEVHVVNHLAVQLK